MTAPNEESSDVKALAQWRDDLDALARIKNAYFKRKLKRLMGTRPHLAIAEQRRSVRA